MSWHRRAATACCVALLAALAAAGAHAEGIALGPTGERTIASLGKLTFTGGISVRCNVTLRASIDSAELSAGATVGTVTGASWSACEGGELEEVLSLPWSLTYSSLRGTPPEELTGLELLLTRTKWGFSVFGGFINCLYEGSLPLSAALSADDPAPVGLTTVLTNSVRLVSGGFGCPATGSISATFGSLALAMAYIPPGGSNHASPATVHVPDAEARAAGGSKTVELISGGPPGIAIENASWRYGNRGWRANAANCVQITLDESRNCQFRVISEPSARTDELRFFSRAVPIITVYVEP